MTEMPTSGDSPFFTPPANFNRPPPPQQIDAAPNGNDLGHYNYEVLYQISQSSF